MWQVFLMYALFGSIFPIGKWGLLAAQPYFLTSIRMFLAGGLMAGYLYIRDPKSLRIKKGDGWLFFLVAFFNVFITNAFEFWGLQYMSAGKTCLIYNLSPFAAALIGYFFNIEKMTWKKWLGLGLGFLSFCPLMIDPWLREEIGTSHSMELMAEGALSISAIAAVVGWTFVRKLTLERGISPTSVNCISFLLAGVMCLISSGLMETWTPLPVSIWPDFIISLLYIVLIHNIICYSIYAKSLKYFSVTFMSFAGLSCPLFAAFLGWLFVGEEIPPPFWLAFIGVLFGLYFFHQEEKQSPALQLSKNS